MRLLALLLISLSFTVGAATPPPESYDRLDAAFPDFTFVTPAGQESKISALRGKVVVVKLWATWCGVCRAKWPQHQALYDAVKHRDDVELVTLSVLEDPALSQSWVDQKGFTVPLYINLVNDRGAVRVADASYYFIKGTPMLFLIDKQGTLRKKVIGSAGAISEADIAKWL